MLLEELKTTSVVGLHHESRRSSNFDVDYVLVYHFNNPLKTQEELEDNVALMIRRLEHAGLHTAIRDGIDGNLLIFVKVNKKRLVEEVYYSR